MEPTAPIRLPVVAEAIFARHLAEIETAIELVARGAARRVTVSGLADAAATMPHAVAMAQRCGVQFRASRDPESGQITVIVGPREA